MDKNTPSERELNVLKAIAKYVSLCHYHTSLYMYHATLGYEPADAVLTGADEKINQLVSIRQGIEILRMEDEKAAQRLDILCSGYRIPVPTVEECAEYVGE